MNESSNSTREITLLDIFKILKKRIKIIACVALVALLLGGAAGAGLAVLNNANYGTQMRFYITSTEENNYILSLLQSDGFAESLLLDKNGLPAEKQGSTEYQNVLTLKEAADKLEAQKEEKELLLEKYPNKITAAQRKYQEAQNKYDALYDRFTLYTTAPVQSEFAGKIAELSTSMEQAATARNEAKDAYDALLDENQNIQEEIDDLTLAIKKAKEDVKAATDIVLADFRANDNNLDQVAKVKKSITYQYALENNKAEIDASQSLLFVKISVPFDQAFAERMLDELTLKLPSYVEDSVVPEKDEKKPECTFISVDGRVGSVDYKNPLTEAVKFGAILLIASAVLMSALFVFIEIFIKIPAKMEEAAEAKALNANDVEETDEAEALEKAEALEETETE